MRSVDFLVVGAGIAGASVAAELAAKASVIVIEQESQPGYHATGRSAAVFSETYGPPQIQALSSASRSFYDHHPTDFCDHPILKPLGLVMVARPDQSEHLDQFLKENQTTAQRLSPDEVCRRVPILRREMLAGGALEPHCQDIDVAGLHQGYLRLMRRRGGDLITETALPEVDRADGSWVVRLSEGLVEAGAIINAAGAWGDTVALQCGARPLGLVAKRRTALTIDLPIDIDPSDWPVVVDIEEKYYFKPEAGRLLLSPADATPSQPTDAQPEEIDVATAVDRFERATDMEVKRIGHRWAGLRTFAPDGTPAVGWDDRVDGFFWLVGQGGYGIQTAPALARFAAALAIGDEIPQDIRNWGVDDSRLSPRRFREG